jgi:hypothetical protein
LKPVLVIKIDDPGQGRGDDRGNVVEGCHRFTKILLKTLRISKLLVVAVLADEGGLFDQLQNFLHRFFQLRIFALKVVVQIIDD